VVWHRNQNLLSGISAYLSRNLSGLGDAAFPANVTPRYLEIVPMPDDQRKPAAWNKAKLPSRHITVGPERAPHRA
jgi:hypothetical protein